MTLLTLILPVAYHELAKPKPSPLGQWSARWLNAGTDEEEMITLIQALNQDFVPNCDDADEDSPAPIPVMEIETNVGLVRRWEDGCSFLFRNEEVEGVRLQWGRNDTFDPLYKKPDLKSRHVQFVYQ